MTAPRPKLTRDRQGRLPTLRPEPARDTKGRYLIQGRAWTRASTVVGTLKDLNGLIDWKRRMVLQGAAAQPELLATVPALAADIAAAGDDWRAAKDAKDALNKVCDQAADVAGANAGSKAGTERHTLSEWADAGRLDEVLHLATEQELADLQSYLDTMDGAGIIRPPQWIERIVVNSTVQSAGTFDRLVYLPDGRLVVADLKSQKTVDFGFLEICCQLAQYAYADHMLNPDTGQLEPLPDNLDTTVGLVMHAPVGKAHCDLYLVDLITGWGAAQAAHEIRTWRSETKTLGSPYRPAQAAPLADRVLRLIADAQHPDALTALWRDPALRAEWTDAHTAAAKARKAQLANL